MNVSRAMCAPHEDSGTTFAPVRHFGWT